MGHPVEHLSNSTEYFNILNKDHLNHPVQDLLRLRLHAPRPPDPRRRHRLRHHRLHLLPAQRGGLQMVRCCCQCPL